MRPKVTPRLGVQGSPPGKKLFTSQPPRSSHRGYAESPAGEKQFTNQSPRSFCVVPAGPIKSRFLRSDPPAPHIGGYGGSPPRRKTVIMAGIPQKRGGTTHDRVSDAGRSKR